MDNQEAIRLIRNLPTMCGFTDAYGEPIDSDTYYEAVDMAISALQAQSEIIRCKDCCFCNLEYDDVGNQYYSCTARFDESGFWDEVKAEDFCSFAERRTDD